MPSNRTEQRSRRSATLLLAALTALAVTGEAKAQAVQPQRPQPGAPPAATAPKQVAPTPGAAPAPLPTPATGLWLDHTGRGAVEIRDCGANLCGHIVWLKEPNDKQGRPLRDALNEDKSKRARPICGLQIIGDVRQQRDGSWDNGWIYDPEQGEAFDVELRLRGPDGLQVKGYKGLKLLSETFQWKRVAELPSPRCIP